MKAVSGGRGAEVSGGSSPTMPRCCSLATLAFEYCKKQKISIAVSMLDRLDKRQQAHTADALVTKLSAANNLDAASLFLKNVLDKHYTVDHLTYTSFINSCYNSNRYALASEISEKISKRISNFQKKDAAAIA